MNKVVGKPAYWHWDLRATYGYNIIAKLEATLISLLILKEFSDIEPTEAFDTKYSLEGYNRGKYENYTKCYWKK